MVKACALGDTLIERQCQAVFKSKKIEKGVAFPTCISVNEYVCHYSPLESESRTLEEGDIIKIDLGVHIDGYIAVTAHTMLVTANDTPPKLTGKAADVYLAAYTAAEAGKFVRFYIFVVSRGIAWYHVVSVWFDTFVHSGQVDQAWCFECCGDGYGEESGRVLWCERCARGFDAPDEEVGEGVYFRLLEFFGGLGYLFGICALCRCFV